MKLIDFLHTEKAKSICSLNVLLAEAEEEKSDLKFEEERLSQLQGELKYRYFTITTYK